MQVCSVLLVAHVGVRRVTVVIVHIGHEEVVVVIYFCVAIFVRDLLYQEMYSLHCEGGVAVVGVVTPLRGGAQVVLHGDQVVELSVLLGVHEEGEVEEDGEGQVEVEREEGEVKEKRTWMTMRMR